MILHYTPQDGPAQHWDLSTVRFLTSEAETVERTTGLEWGDVCSRGMLVLRKSPTARRAIAWVLLKRADPALRYSAFDPAIDDIDVRFSADDVAELRAEAEERLVKGQVSSADFDEGMADIEKLSDPDAVAAPTGPKGEADSALTASPVAV